MVYDVIIIGSGISGASCAYYISEYNLKCLVLEKNGELASGTTKANSAIMHAGYDPVCNSLKAKYNILGQKLLKGVLKRLDVPYRMNGSFVLDFDNSPKLDELYQRGIKNGVKNLRIVDRNFILRKNPLINKNVKRALYAKTAGVIDPFLFNIKMCENAKLNGCEFLFNKDVTEIKKEGDNFIVKAKDSCFTTKSIINAAGLYSDFINNLVSSKKYNIIPVKGEYYLLDKSEKSLTENTLFQLPTNKGKGILITKTTDGNILVGPNAIKVDNKDDNSIGISSIKEMFEKAKKTIPSLTLKNVITTFAGVRATLEGESDFIIGEAPDVKNFYNLLGIDSPGLSSCLGYSSEIVKLIIKNLNLRKKTKKEIKCLTCSQKHFNLLSNYERKELIFKNKEYGQIICNCEKVSLAEIKNAINSQIPAQTLDEIKHRTRAGAGRCQSGFCQNDIVKIIAKELGISPLEVTKKGGKSFILKDKTK